MEDKYPSNNPALDDAYWSDYEDSLVAGELSNILATTPAGTAANPKPAAKAPNSAGNMAKTAAVPSTSASNNTKASKAAGNTSKSRPPSKKNPLCLDSNVKYVPPPAQATNSHPSPGRKYRRIQGSGVDNDFC
jgi:hypothetical protein